MASVNEQELRDNLRDAKWLLGNHLNVRKTIEVVPLDATAQRELWKHELFRRHLARHQALDKDLLCDIFSHDDVDAMIFKEILVNQKLEQRHVHETLYRSQNLTRHCLLLQHQGALVAADMKANWPAIKRLVSDDLAATEKALLGFCRDQPQTVRLIVHEAMCAGRTAFLHTLGKKVFFPDDAVDVVAELLGKGDTGETVRRFLAGMAQDIDCSAHKKAELLLLA